MWYRRNQWTKQEQVDGGYEDGVERAGCGLASDEDSPAPEGSATSGPASRRLAGLHRRGGRHRHAPSMPRRAYPRLVWVGREVLERWGSPRHRDHGAQLRRPSVEDGDELDESGSGITR